MPTKQAHCPTACRIGIALADIELLFEPISCTASFTHSGYVQQGGRRFCPVSSGKRWFFTSEHKLVLRSCLLICGLEVGMSVAVLTEASDDASSAPL